MTHGFRGLCSRGENPGGMAQFLVERSTVSFHIVGQGSERGRHKGGPG